VGEEEMFNKGLISRIYKESYRSIKRQHNLKRGGVTRDFIKENVQTAKKNYEYCMHRFNITSHQRNANF
jgi:hypothetical protein